MGFFLQYAGRNKKSKGIFGGLFSKKPNPADAAASAAAIKKPSGPAKPQSAAAAAASRWVRGPDSGSTSSLADLAPTGGSSDNPTTALLSAKVVPGKDGRVLML